MSVLDTIRDVVMWPVKAVTNTITSIAHHVRTYFAHPSIEQLANADFGIQLGLAVFSFIYAIAFLVVGAPFMALFFAGLGAYYTWLLVKLTPWWNRLIQFVWLEEAWNDAGLADGTIATAA